MWNGQLLQSMLIEKNGFIHQPVTLPLEMELREALPTCGEYSNRQWVDKLMAQRSIQFELETPDNETESDLRHVRVWRAGPGMIQSEALKIMVCFLHSVCFG